LRSLAHPRLRGALFLPALAHPGWWMSAREGDCGIVLREMTMAGTVAAAVLLSAGALYASARAPSHRPPALPRGVVALIVLAVVAGGAVGVWRDAVLERRIAADS
jgi:hypothetical protein